MKRVLLAVICLCMTFIFFACNKEINITKQAEENIISILNINIDSPDGIELEIISADPTYTDKTTILGVKYLIRNNTESILQGSKYNIVFRAYKNDGKALFEMDSKLMFSSVTALEPNTYTESSCYSPIIDGIEKIDRLEITFEKNY